MNDKKRQEIFEHDSRWVSEFNNGHIRVDHWDEDPNVYRTGARSNFNHSRWWYTYHKYDDKARSVFDTGLSDKNLLRRLIP